MRIDFHIDGFRRYAADYRLFSAGRVVAGNLVGGVVAMIELDHLVAGYEGLAITPSLSGTIETGSMTAIVGLNGCGKSTLLKTLAGFIPPVSGYLNWRGRRPVIGWLAQRHALESQFPLTVQDVVSQGSWPRVSLLRGLKGEVLQRIVASLERVGLLAMAKTPIEELSGGQFQRMLFARVMVQRAPLVMLDEPFTGIDEATCRELMTLILEMHQQGQTILAVLHDNQRVADYFPETLLLTSQRARWGNTADVLPAFHSARLA
ncbi:Fe(3+) dicitrate transport ATP-binding protein FecE [Klebsiella spallanzanii]|uniref:Fe(3+) dicitrate transport ATP-binding protein FecE n=1 Tax=Klebsiella spallanzanii TaxID=2587528 RepID=A0ABY6VJX1_9ENTR|nr:Fe(3+) dicitrate transport ATP-binding protein FecE [Klebsiella spallanzanii]